MKKNFFYVTAGLLLILLALLALLFVACFSLAKTNRKIEQEETSQVAVSESLLDEDTEADSQIAIETKEGTLDCIGEDFLSFCDGDTYSLTENTLYAIDEEAMEDWEALPAKASETMGKCQANPEICLTQEEFLTSGCLVPGLSRLSCQVRGREVVCLELTTTPFPESLRVLLKNGEDVAWQNLYVTCQQDYEINGQEVEAGQILCLRDSLDKDGAEVLRIHSDQGQLILCDREGNAIGEAYPGDFLVRNYEENDFTDATEGTLDCAKEILANELSIEEYLTYVLPSEMPLSFSYEALKAQAVCARTFAYEQITSTEYLEWGANLDNTTMYQVYHKGGSYSLTDQAVEATAGMVLTENGLLNTCYYYSTSPDSLDGASPYQSWTAELDFVGGGDERIGHLRRVLITQTDEKGYATEIKVFFERGAIFVEGEYNIRKYLGQFIRCLSLKDGSLREASFLPSAYMSIASYQDGSLTLSGGGFGHGRGMSQYGADALGDQGYSYQEILEYYYQGSQLKKF